MHYNKKYDGITHTLEDSTMLNSNKNKKHKIFINYSIILLGMRRRAAMVEGKYYLFFFVMRTNNDHTLERQVLYFIEINLQKKNKSRTFSPY